MNKLKYIAMFFGSVILDFFTYFSTKYMAKNEGSFFLISASLLGSIAFLIGLLNFRRKKDDAATVDRFIMARFIIVFIIATILLACQFAIKRDYYLVFALNALIQLILAYILFNPLSMN
ncbi:MAG: hypothetical protein VZQ47_04805 [Treponema sp.]|nr:hypothetical protein [Treponema sp.]MEE3434854.1 hypothetical protein [Treponema sp.]